MSNVSRLRPLTRTPASATLARAIRGAGLTQEQAGKLVGVEDRQVRRWLKGAARADRLDLLCAIEALTESKKAA